MNAFEIIAVLWMAVGIITVMIEKIKAIIKKEPLEITCPKEAAAVFFFLFLGPIAWLYVGLLNLYYWRESYLEDKRRNKIKSNYRYPKSK